ncbi:MAG: Crp/Fnr family transcriptional regulator [Pseudomonadota bacterium]
MNSAMRSVSTGGFHDESSICAACAVRNSSLCGALSAEELASLNKISRRKTLDRGQFHVLEGDIALDFANIVSGVGKLVRGAYDGRTQIVGLLFPSDFIGAYADGPAGTAEPYSIEAATELELCLFPRSQFKVLAQQYPGLEHRLLARTLNELQVARDWMVLLGRKTAPEKVATFLLHIGERMQNQGCTSSEGFDLPLSRSDIADHIGLTVETVSRQISNLRKAGVLEIEGARRISHIDVDALAAQAGF